MSNSAETSRVLTLVFTDLADSTALKTARGDVAVGDLISRHREHVTRLAEECAGRVIDWAGDGCFLTFETSSAGVMFALRLQQTHAEESDLPGVRVGIHMGEVTEKPGPGDAPRIEGLAVDLAARVSGLAKPGQVLMSAAVYDSARQRIGIDALGTPIMWQAHGTYELKGFDKELEIGEAGLEGFASLEAPKASDKAKLVRRAKRRAGTARPSAAGSPRRSNLVPLALAAVIVVLIAVLAFVLGQQRATQQPASSDGAAAESVENIGPIASLAVLPLDNLMNDPDQDYFADGMTEAIIAELAKIKALKVISRTSVMRYKETDLSMPEIAAELNVDGIIEGSVLRDGDEVRITVQLIHGATDAHLWSESYIETITSVLKLQSDIALAIADELKVTLAPEEAQRVTESQEVNPDAYNAFLLGQHFRQNHTLEGLTQALAFFEDATELDPGYAEAWASAADTHLQIAYWGVDDPQERYPLARRAVRRAYELEEDNALAHQVLAGLALDADRDWQEADKQYRRAVELAPNDPWGHIAHGFYLSCIGDSAGALTEAATALDLDPHSSALRQSAARILNLNRETERAGRILEEILREDPTYLSAQQPLAKLYSNVGRHAEAIELADRFAESTEGDVIGRTTRMRVYAGAGRATEARAMLNELLAESDLYYDPVDVAQTYLMLGDLDRAFEWYEKGTRERSGDTVLLRITAAGLLLPESPELEQFRNDPRYWDLVERIGFPPLPPDNPGYAAEQAWHARKAAAEEANAPIRKIAVLPFDNMMRDDSQEYFVDGMTEALITELAQIKSLQVRGRTTVMRYKGTDKSIPEIARELDVDGIIEGSVLRDGDEVRITAQLIHGPSDVHRWAGSFDSTVTSIFKLHSDMAMNIAREVKANLTPQEEALLVEADEVNPEAYEQVLMGRFAANRLSPSGLAEAEARARRAIELAPDYADAYGLLGDALGWPAGWGWARRRDTIDEERQVTARGLELDPANPNLLTDAGGIAVSFDFDWREGERYYARAIDSDYTNPSAYNARSWLLAALGEYEEAIESAKRGMELDPFNPFSLDILEDAYANAGRYEEAIEVGERALRIDPDNVGNLINQMQRYAEVGREDDFRRTWEHLAGLGEDLAGTNAQYYATGLALLGRHDEAREVMDLVVADQEIYVDPGSLVWFYAALGEEEKVFEWLETAYKERSMIMLTLNTRWTRVLDPYRDDPRFQAITEKMNFPK